MSEREPDVVDATRRTRLAAERTYLAWWRSGVTALAVALAAGAIVPELSDGPRWPYALVAGGFGLLGVAVVIYGAVRQRRIEAALRHGGYPALDDRVVLTLTAVTAVLGLATLLVVALDA
jgi:putative membrane protein